jgi:hypothetical protein
MRFLLESPNHGTRSFQRYIEIVDAKESQQTIARWRNLRAHQGWMLMRAPLVETEQNGSICIQDLTPALMDETHLPLAKERLVPFETGGNVAYADDRPCALHRLLSR